jgi:hypothetical protein
MMMLYCGTMLERWKWKVMVATEVGWSLKEMVLKMLCCCAGDASIRRRVRWGMEMDSKVFLMMACSPLMWA